MKKLIYLLLFLHLSFIYSSELLAAFSAPEDSKMYKAVRELLDDVKEITGLKFKLIHMPMKRSRDALIKGEIDLDIARTNLAYTNYSDIIYCNESVIDVSMYVYTKTPNYDIEINKLKNNKLVYTLGNKIIEDWISQNNIEKYVTAKSIYKSFELLLLDRANYLIGPPSFENYIRNFEIFSDIYKIEKELFITEQLIAMHKKNSHLEPKISDAIKILKLSGRLEEIANNQY